MLVPRYASLACVGYSLLVKASSLAPSLLRLGPAIANTTAISTAFPGLFCFNTHSGELNILSGCEGPIHNICAPPWVHTQEDCFAERLLGRDTPYRFPFNWESTRPTTSGSVCRVEFLHRNTNRSRQIKFSFRAIQDAARLIIHRCDQGNQRKGGILWIDQHEGDTGFYVQVTMDNFIRK